MNSTFSASFKLALDGNTEEKYGSEVELHPKWLAELDFNFRVPSIPTDDASRLISNVERSEEPLKPPAPAQLPVTSWPDVVTSPEVAGIVAAN